MILHFLPHFPGAQKSEGFCFQGERLHSGRDPKEAKGGTEKAEDAKPPDAGISPKQCPGKGVAEKWTAYEKREMSVVERHDASNDRKDDGGKVRDACAIQAGARRVGL